MYIIHIQIVVIARKPVEPMNVHSPSVTALRVYFFCANTSKIMVSALPPGHKKVLITGREAKA